jgi:hypothetical protein
VKKSRPVATVLSATFKQEHTPNGYLKASSENTAAPATPAASGPKEHDDISGKKKQPVLESS